MAFTALNAKKFFRADIARYFAARVLSHVMFKTFLRFEPFIAGAAGPPDVGVRAGVLGQVRGRLKLFVAHGTVELAAVWIRVLDPLVFDDIGAVDTPVVAELAAVGQLQPSVLIHVLNNQASALELFNENQGYILYIVHF